tara:strand:- start:254 stop:601 length:348 start_codon:yes stop_codon:yes gene_type:complete
MPEPTNKALYNRVKAAVVKKNPKHSAYRSGMIVKKYKEAGGKYSGKKPTKTGLSRWFKEDWRTEKGKKTYKEGGTIFRPTKRVTKDTPTTMSELSKKRKTKAIKEKKQKGRVTKY